MGPFLNKNIPFQGTQLVKKYTIQGVISPPKDTLAVLLPIPIFIWKCYPQEVNPYVLSIVIYSELVFHSLIF